MSLHEKDSLDRYLSRLLKNCVTPFRPPSNTKVRLLKAAALQVALRQSPNIPFLLISHALRPDYKDVSFNLFAKAIRYSLQTGMVIL